MKILLISPKEDKPTGGISIWTNAYLEAIEAKEIGDVTVVNTAAVGERAVNGSAKRNILDEFKRTRRILRDLKQALRKETFDVAHINTSCGTFGVIRDFLIAKRIKKKAPSTRIVVHYHCDIPYQVGNKLSKHYLRKLSALADARLVLCENSRKYLKEQFSLESEKVPNFIDENSILEGEKTIRETVERIFFVGRVSSAKGAAEIYELARRFPAISFRLAGAVSEEVAQWELPQNLSLLGPLSHDNVLREMDEADLFLFPSHSEGFSVALMEAMARGLPAIATDVGANADMLNLTGSHIVSVGDVVAMSNALEHLKNAQVRAQISLASVKKVKENYVAEVVMENLKRYYASRDTIASP